MMILTGGLWTAAALAFGLATGFNIKALVPAAFGGFMAGALVWTAPPLLALFVLGAQRIFALVRVRMRGHLPHVRHRQLMDVAHLGDRHQLA